MPGPAVEGVSVGADTVPTDRLESDGTLAWDSTTCVVVEISAGDETGLGYTYGHQAVATLVSDKIAPLLEGRDAFQIGEAWWAVVGALRNQGRPGITSMAVSAVDIALWDLKARLLGCSVATLLDGFHDGVPVYGSGGFTSYAIEHLQSQLARWVEQGIPRVKMKVGRHPEEDTARVRAARAAIGDDVELYVDANGAWKRKQALEAMQTFAEFGVSWVEEPVTSDDLAGLRLLRDRGPAGMDVTAGEYGYDLPYFRDMLRAGAVDCMQADVTRCGGITAVQRVSALCDAETIDLSAHCAPAISAHAFTAVWHLRHLEYFHDHIRVEERLFDGLPEQRGGMLRVDHDRPGLGLELKRSDAEQYAA
ncbi:MAG: enolase C-terminal domain-like protein [Egibacteraceae bacterium]